MDISIILPIIFAFLLALFSTKEIFFNRLNVTTSGKLKLVGKLVLIFLNTYGYLLILIFGFVFYYAYVDSRGTDGAGMIILFPFLFIVPISIAYILGLVFSVVVFFNWVDDYLESLKLNSISNEVSFKYYKYPVTIFVIVISIVSVVLGPFLISSYIHSEKDNKYKIATKGKMDKDIANKNWWGDHVVNPNVKPIDQLNTEDLILQKNEIPPRYYLSRSEIIDDKLDTFSNTKDRKSLKLRGLDATPDKVSDLYVAVYGDYNLHQFDNVSIAVLKYSDYEDLKDDLLIMKENNNKPVKKNFIVLSNYIIVIDNDLAYLDNKDRSLTGLILEKFPDAQISFPNENTSASSSLIISVPTSTPVSQKIPIQKPDFKIISPNGGESIKIGYERGLYWNSNVSTYIGAQLDAEIFEITGDKIIFDKNGACTNCIGGGLRSGISASQISFGGAGNIEWKSPGITYSGTRLKPGSHYVIKAVVSKTGTYEKGECPKSYPVCIVDIATDWSDGVFTLVD